MANDSFITLNINTHGEVLKGDLEETEEVEKDEGTEVEHDFLSVHRFAKVADDEDFTFILGPVLVPEEVDKQGEIISAEEIEQAAHSFIEDNGTAGLVHKVMLKRREAVVVESYIERGNRKVNGQTIKKGTWMLGMRVYDNDIRKMILDGDLKGYSIGGTGRRIEEDDE